MLQEEPTIAHQIRPDWRLSISLSMMFCSTVDGGCAHEMMHAAALGCKRLQ